MALGHDIGLLPVVQWFPDGSINNWKALEWKERSRWGFLAELPIRVKVPIPLFWD
jgi:hypothetical protein